MEEDDKFILTYYINLIDNTILDVMLIVKTYCFTTTMITDKLKYYQIHPELHPDPVLDLQDMKSTNTNFYHNVRRYLHIHTVCSKHEQFFYVIEDAMINEFTAKIQEEIHNEKLVKDYVRDL